MIRREAGSDFLLITQDAHARLAGQLAEHFGNDRFARPEPRGPMLTGVRLHDSGWPLHDDQPTLNPGHLPLDVFEVPRAIALKVWSASAERTAAIDPYAGLLVSLHSLALSIYATSHTSMQHEKFDVSEMSERFEINKFQHREVERQERLRALLGMRTDIPLTHGLAEPHASGQEDILRANFRLLQAADLMSLCLCCTHPPAVKTQEVFARPGQASISLSLTMQHQTLVVSPWPFDAPSIEVSIPFRRVPAKAFKDSRELWDILNIAPLEHLPALLAQR